MITRKNFDALAAALLISDGRDKLGKTIQYTLKLLAILYEKHTRKEKRSTFEEYSLTGAKNLVKAISSARRIFRFGNWIKSSLAFFDAIKQNSSNSFISTLLRNSDIFTNLFGIGSCVCDDVSLIQLTWEGKSSELCVKIEKAGDKCWAFSCIFDIAILLLQWKQSRDNNKVLSFEEKRLLLLNIIKLQSDFIFAASSGFSLRTSDIILAISALTSASIGVFKVWQKVKK